VLNVQQVERRTLADRQVAAVYLAAGAEDVTMPDPEQARAEFDAALQAAPRPMTWKQRMLRQLTGVA